MTAIFSSGAYARGMLVVCLLVMFCIGCASAQIGRERKPWYQWGFHNVSDRVLSEVHAEYHFEGVRDRPSAGWARPGGGGVFGPGLDPIPPRVTVRWRMVQPWDPENPQLPQNRLGPVQEQELEVTSRISDLKAFSGTIWFIYLGPDQGWTVVPLTFAERREQAIRAARGELGQRDPTVPTPDKYLPATRPATQPADDPKEWE